MREVRLGPLGLPDLFHSDVAYLHTYDVHMYCSPGRCMLTRPPMFEELGTSPQKVEPVPSFPSPLGRSWGLLGENELDC